MRLRRQNESFLLSDPGMVRLVRLESLSTDVKKIGLDIAKDAVEFSDGGITFPFRLLDAADSFRHVVFLPGGVHVQIDIVDIMRFDIRHKDRADLSGSVV